MSYDGLKILYDGRQYTVLHEEGRSTREIGELLLEADFLPQDKVLNWIRLDPRKDEPVPARWEDAVDFVFLFAEEMIEDPVLFSLFCGMFGGIAQKISRFISRGEDCIVRYLEETNMVLHSDDEDHQARLALLGQDISLDDHGEFLVACFNEYHLAYQDYRIFLSAVASDCSDMADEDDIYAIKALKDLYKKHSSYQSIGCRILYDDESGMFTTEYTLKSLYSLLAFEYAHMQETGSKIKICANCGRLFVPKKRSDEIYCTQPAPGDDKGRTCKEIGAWVSHKNKMAKDELESAYRKKYQYFNVAYNRHRDDPEGAELAKKRERFKREGRDMKKKLKDGRITSEEFLSWIDSF